MDAAVPYSDLAGDRDPVAVLAEAPERIQEVVRDRVEWIIRVLAGHDLHHLQQLRTIAGR